MRVPIIIITTFFTSTQVHSQVDGISFDTASSEKLSNNSKYYSKTNFSIIDTIELWNYFFDKTYHGEGPDSIKPLGEIHFWRTKAIDDQISNKIYGHLWTPNISFEIFSIKDSSYCYTKSNRIRFSSSCVPPDVGGDIIKIGAFILISRSVCLNCQRYDTKIDYCRPILNYIFSKIDQTKVLTLESLVRQFVIKERKPK